MKKRYDAYANYYYNYNKKGKTKNKILAILFVIVSIAIVVFFSISFSNFLTISKIVNINTNYINEPKTLYAISLFKSQKSDDAFTYAQDVKKQGGAGYVYNYNSSYYVITSVYKTISDANKVKNSLQDNSINAELISIDLPSLNLKATLSTKSREVLTNSLNLFYNSYSKLYKLSIEYDKQNIDLIKIKEEFKTLFDDNNKTIQNYNTYFNQSTNVYVLYTKIYLNKLNNLIKNCESVDESVNISSFIKETYCKCLAEYLNLYNEIP